MKLLLYCTKSKPYLYREDDDTFKLENKQLNEDISEYKKYYGLNNGKIVAECDYEVEEISKVKDIYDDTYFYDTPTLYYDELLKKSCLNNNQLEDYLEFNGYAIHIKNLHIFDKVKTLDDYMLKTKKENHIWCYKINENYYYPVEKAPQNMMYCYGNNTGEKYILISIRAEWLCKILNGEKTIEIRKKVLKEMIS